MKEEDKSRGASKKEREEQEIIKTLLKEDRILVPSSEDIEGLSSRGYGTSENGGLALRFYEALYLLSKGVIELKGEETGSPVAFQELLQRYRLVSQDAWARYLIYRDLRSRGYVVREGFGLGIDFRVYKRGEYGKSAAEYLILGIQEGQPVVVEDLARILTRVQSLKKTLILSVLNRRGEIVYYTLSRLSFK